MYKKEKEIINKSFQLFISKAIEIIESDAVQRILYQTLDDHKYGRGPGFTRIKDFGQFDDPCLWLLAKPHHPDDILKESDPQEQLIMSRVYEFVIVLEVECHAIKSVWDVLKPFEPNILHCSLVAQWMDLPNDEYINISDFEPGDDTQTITYKNNSFSTQKV